LLLLLVLIILGCTLLVLLRVPIAFAFGIGAIVMMVVFDVDAQWAVTGSFRLILTFVFLALSMYLMMGTFAGTAGIADRLSNFVVAAIGRIKGGLGVAVIVTNGIFGAISGTAMSALAGIGKAFLPSMSKEGYPVPYIAALLCCSAVLALLIPPSGTMILFGFMGRLPISLCFLAPLIPGLILIFLLSITHLTMARKIASIHVPPKVTLKVYGKELVQTVRDAFLGLILPVFVLGGIYGGFITPVEAASFGVLYIFIVGFFIYRSIKPRGFLNDVLDVGLRIGSIIALIFFFMVLGRIFIMEKVSETILEMMFRVTDNPLGIMVMLNILMLIMGMIIDDASAMIITAIVLLPIARSIGFDPYHFAAIACVNLGIGLITPPVAALLYLAEAVFDTPVHTFIKGAFTYILFCYIPVLLLTIFFPQLSTTLPYLMMNIR